MIPYYFKIIWTITNDFFIFPMGNNFQRWMTWTFILQTCLSCAYIPQNNCYMFFFSTKNNNHSNQEVEIENIDFLLN